MKWLNKHSLPKRITRQLGTIYQPKPKRISTTTLIDCPRIYTLQLTKWDDIVLDYSEFIQTVIGLSVHERMDKVAKVMSVFDDDEESEVKFEDKIGDTTVVGKADNYFEEDGEHILLETKVKGVGVLDFPNFMTEVERQMNVYAWQRRKRDYPVDSMMVDIWYRDWKNWEADRDKAKWAVMKKGRKTSIKNFASKDEAEMWKSQQTKDKSLLYIEERPAGKYPPISLDHSVPVKLWTFEEQKEYIEEQVEYFSLAPMDCSEECRWRNSIRCGKYCKVKSVCEDSPAYLKNRNII